MSDPELVLVGNGFSAGLGGLGSRVDAGRVVRFNCFRTEGLEEHVGTRTDVWACNLSWRDTEPELRLRAAARPDIGSFLLIPPEGGQSFRERLDGIRRLVRRLYREVPVELVSPDFAAGVKARLGYRATTGLLAVEHYLERHPRVWLHGFDVLRGGACPPRHYWGGPRSNIRRMHRPELEAAWLRRRIEEGRVALLEPGPEELELSAAQTHEWSKYRGLFSDPTGAGDRGYGASNHARHVYRRLRRLAPRSVVDVGCGNGELCRWLRGSLGTPEVIAVDWASIPDLPPSVRFYRAPAWRLPLPDHAVDYLTSFDVLEHLLPEDVDATLQEFARVARRGMVLSIAFRDSRRRAADGSSLHPTVRPAGWWEARLSALPGCRVERWPGGPSGYFHCRFGRDRGRSRRR